MYGGKFLANGADTCVYDPPVSCDPPNPSIDVENKVSRIVSVSSGEREKQAFLQKVIQDVEPVFPSIRDYVNFATDSCTPKFKPEDEQQSCKVKDLANGKLVNLITPKQGKDFWRLAATPEFKEKFPTYMMLLATAMSYLNEYGLMHTDLHAANIALMNNKLVAHDWGRSFNSRDERELNNYLDWAKRTTGDLKIRGEYRYIVPILNNSGYFQGLINQTTKPGKKKLQMVLTRSWDTLALIGTSEYQGLITKDEVDKFLSAFVRIVAQKDGDFSVRLREIIPLAFVSTSVIPPAVIPPVKAKRTRKVNSKPKKTRKAKVVPPPVVAPPPPVISPMVAPVVPPAVVPPPVVPPVVAVKPKRTRKVKSKKRKSVPPVVVPPPVVPPVASIPKSMYVSESASNQEVTELRKDIAACDQEVDELRKKVQDIAVLAKLGPRRGGTRRNSRR